VVPQPLERPFEGAPRRELVEQEQRRERARERHGMYVVGWFAADDWDESDWRRPRCGRRSLQETRAFFDARRGRSRRR
jgi:hypothetical protein